jgi:MFS family permease
VNLAVAALAMVATLPGRTQGLGLITEPLLADLHLDRVVFAQLNLWATLIGAAFCLACGPLIDRFGTRWVQTVVMAMLGAVVMSMSRVNQPRGLLIDLVLTRGLGQSALSVVSLAIVGKWFVRKLPIAMGIFSALIAIGFVAAFPGVLYAVHQSNWRSVWWWMGLILLAVLTPLGWLLVRPTPESIGLAVDGRIARADEPTIQEVGYTLLQALRTAAFWIFALASAMFLLVSSGIQLFNESILRERGFGIETFQLALGIIVLTGLGANFLGGWLTQKWPMGRLMGIAMMLLAASLLALPLARSVGWVIGYAVTMGISSGIVTVVFFTCWGKAVGRRHLGKIQGAAQLLTVLASAAGPLLLAESVRRTGSYAPLMYRLAPLVALLGLACWWAPMPASNTQPD